MTAQDTKAEYRTEKEIRGWLKEEGYSLVEVDVQDGNGDRQPSWAFGVLFSPNATNATQRKIPIVLVGREEIGRVDAILEVALAPAHAELLNSGSYVSKLAFKKIRERIFLHGTGLSFPRNAEGELERIRLDESVYSDAPLTRDRVMTILRRLYAVLLFASDVMTEVSDEEGTSGVQLGE